MSLMGQISHGTTSPETLLGILATEVLILGAAVRCIRRLAQAPRSPDPWDETVDAEIEQADATPLCHRCLSPHRLGINFCPDCGAPVGQYTNWLPFPQLFSVGHALRIGTSGEFKRTPLTVLGFLLFSLGEYALFVPVYWFVFIRRIFERRTAETSPPPSPSAPKPTAP